MRACGHKDPAPGCLLCAVYTTHLGGGLPDLLDIEPGVYAGIDHPSRALRPWGIAAEGVLTPENLQASYEAAVERMRAEEGQVRPLPSCACGCGRTPFECALAAHEAREASGAPLALTREEFAGVAARAKAFAERYPAPPPLAWWRRALLAVLHWVEDRVLP